MEGRERGGSGVGVPARGNPWLIIVSAAADGGANNKG